MKKIITFLFISTIFFGSCQKEAGILGKKSLSGTVYYKNGATAINEIAPGAVVKIAYGANAATADFDQFIYADVNGQYKIEGLKKGDYFITAEFTDSHGFNYVTAGYLITIKNKKSDLQLDINLE